MYNTIPWFIFPKWKELTTFLKDILEEEVDQKYYLNQKQVDKILYSNFIQEKRRIQYGNCCETLLARDYKDAKCVKIKNATKKWYLEAKPWDWIILDNPNSKTKRWRVKNQISWTLTVAWEDWVLEKDYRIRKLTPLEYERLQWFPDWWSSDIVSNSQAYKQMWNAISVPVVKEIFNNLFRA